MAASLKIFFLLCVLGACYGAPGNINFPQEYHLRSKRDLANILNNPKLHQAIGSVTNGAKPEEVMNTVMTHLPMVHQLIKKHLSGGAGAGSGAGAGAGGGVSVTGTITTGVQGGLGGLLGKGGSGGHAAALANLLGKASSQGGASGKASSGSQGGSSGQGSSGNQGGSSSQGSSGSQGGSSGQGSSGSGGCSSGKGSSGGSGSGSSGSGSSASASASASAGASRQRRGLIPGLDSLMAMPLGVVSEVTSMLPMGKELGVPMHILGSIL